MRIVCTIQKNMFDVSISKDVSKSDAECGKVFFFLVKRFQCIVHTSNPANGNVARLSTRHIISRFENGSAGCHRFWNIQLDILLRLSLAGRN